MGKGGGEFSNTIPDCAGPWVGRGSTCRSISLTVLDPGQTPPLSSEETGSRQQTILCSVLAISTGTFSWTKFVNWHSVTVSNVYCHNNIIIRVTVCLRNLCKVRQKIFETFCIKMCQFTKYSLVYLQLSQYSNILFLLYCTLIYPRKNNVYQSCLINNQNVLIFYFYCTLYSTLTYPRKNNVYQSCLINNQNIVTVSNVYCHNNIIIRVTVCVKKSV